MEAVNTGAVDLVAPPFSPGLASSITDPAVATRITFGRDYEALYFQVGQDPTYAGPFADPTYRSAFVKSIDRQALFAQLYAPLLDGAQLLQCGPIVPGRYCS